MANIIILKLLRYIVEVTTVESSQEVLFEGENYKYNVSATEVIGK